MLPGSTDAQFVLSSQLEIDPSTSVNYYTDYFGTRVAAFDVLAGHSALDITARSLVEVRPRPVEFPDIGWDRLERESARAILSRLILRGTPRSFRPQARLSRTVPPKRNGFCESIVTRRRQGKGASAAASRIVITPDWLDFRSRRRMKMASARTSSINTHF